MNQYINVKVNISEGQKQKLQSTLRSNEPVSISFGHEDLKGGHLLILTKSQMKKR